MAKCSPSATDAEAEHIKVSGRAAITMASPASVAPSSTPGHPIGSSFLKKFNGYGVWKGEIKSFDGEWYRVYYPDDGFEEDITIAGMDRIMARSARLRASKVKVATRTTDMIFYDEQGLPTGREDDVKPSPPIEKAESASKRPLAESRRARVAGDPVTKVEASSLETARENPLSSSWCKRARKAVNAYAPPPPRGAPRERADEVEEPSLVRTATLKIASSGAAEEDPPEKKKRKCNPYYYEGFKFIKGGSQPSRHKYFKCVHHHSSGCLVKLKVDPETGVIPYTSSGTPAEHTEDCKLRNKKAEPQSTPTDASPPIVHANTDAQKPTVTKKPKVDVHRYHRGFKFTRISNPRGHYYRCSYHRSAKCPMKLKVDCETGAVRVYASGGEVAEHTNECRCKNGKAELPTIALDAPESAMAPEEKSTLTEKPKDVHLYTDTPKPSSAKNLNADNPLYHRGFKFTRISNPRGHYYHCSHRRSTKCPIRLKVDRETGAISEYTPSGELAKHTEVCRFKNQMAKPPPIMIDAEQSAPADALQSCVAKTSKGIRCCEGLKFYTHWGDHFRCCHFSSAKCPVKLKVDHETGTISAYTSGGDPAEHTEECKRKNRDMWAQSPPSVTLNVAEAAAGSAGEDDAQKREGFDLNGDSSSRIALPERETMLEKNVAANEKETKELEKEGPPVQSEMLKRGQDGSSPIASKAPMVAIGNGARQGRKLTSKSAAAVSRALRGWETRRKRKADTLNKYETKELDQEAPSSRKEVPENNELEDHNGDTDSSICKLPYRFKSGQHVWVIAGKARHHAVIYSIANDNDDGEMMAKVKWATTNGVDKIEVGRLRPMFEEGNGEFVSSSFSRRERKRTPWYVPPKPPGQPRKNTRAQEARSVKKMQRTKEEEVGSDFVRRNLASLAHVPSGVAPGPGWKSETVRYTCNGRGRNHKRWISPREGITFKIPRAAFEFEEIREGCGGDEQQALGLYLKGKQASGDRTYICSRGRLGRAMTCVDKALPLEESESDVDAELDLGPLDEDEEMTIAELGRFFHGASRSKLPLTKSGTEEKTDQPSTLFDQSANVTEREAESYKLLWDYYLKPTTREKEELPSGMILRRKEAPCNLLRFRDSIFRQKIHCKILRLQKLGRKDEIHRLLKALYDHDKSMQSGDGPCELMDEILGKRSAHAEVEVLDSSDVAELLNRSGGTNTPSTDIDIWGDKCPQKPSGQEQQAGEQSIFGQDDSVVAGVATTRTDSLMEGMASSKKKSAKQKNTKDRGNMDRFSKEDSPSNVQQKQQSVINLCEDDEEELDSLHEADRHPSLGQKDAHNFLQRGQRDISEGATKERCTADSMCTNNESCITATEQKMQHSQGDNDTSKNRHQLFHLCAPENLELNSKSHHRKSTGQSFLNENRSKGATDSSIASSTSSVSISRGSKCHRQSRLNSILSKIGPNQPHDNHSNAKPKTNVMREARTRSAKAPSTMFRENVIDLCEGDGLDQADTSELDGSLSHDQQAVKSVLREWIQEEGTTDCSIDSSIACPNGTPNQIDSINQKSEIIDLSQEEELAPTSEGGVIVIE